jgi:hypothetical protein
LTLKIIECYIRLHELVTFPIWLSPTVVSSFREVAGALGGAGFFRCDRPRTSTELRHAPGHTGDQGDWMTKQSTAGARAAASPVDDAGAVAAADGGRRQPKRRRRPAPKADVMHWWTSSSESAAVRKFADAYRAAGGVWVDTAIAGADQAKAVAINRIVGGNPPTAAQFNTTKQFRDLIDQGVLNNVDEIAARDKLGPVDAGAGAGRDPRQGPLLRAAGRHPHVDLDLVFEGRVQESRHRQASRPPRTSCSPRWTS